MKNHLSYYATSGELLANANLNSFLAFAREGGAASYKTVHQAKAVVHTYLAWQDEPGHPIGQSITAKVLQPTTPTAHYFTDWLGSLFSGPA